MAIKKPTTARNLEARIEMLEQAVSELTPEQIAAWGREVSDDDIARCIEWLKVPGNARGLDRPLSRPPAEANENELIASIWPTMQRFKEWQARQKHAR